MNGKEFTDMVTKTLDDLINLNERRTDYATIRQMSQRKAFKTLKDRIARLKADHKHARELAMELSLELGRATNNFLKTIDALSTQNSLTVMGIGNRLEKATHEKERLEGVRDILASEAIELKAMIKWRDGLLDEKQKQVGDLQGRLTAVQNLYAESKDLYREQQRKIEALCDDRRVLEQEKDDLTTRMEDRKKIIERQNVRLKDNQTLIDNYAKESCKLVNQIEGVRSEIAELKAELDANDNRQPVCTVCRLKLDKCDDPIGD